MEQKATFRISVGMGQKGQKWGSVALEGVRDGCLVLIKLVTKLHTRLENETKLGGQIGLGDPDCMDGEMTRLEKRGLGCG